MAALHQTRLPLSPHLHQLPRLGHRVDSISCWIDRVPPLRQQRRQWLHLLHHRVDHHRRRSGLEIMEDSDPTGQKRILGLSRGCQWILRRPLCRARRIDVPHWLLSPEGERRRAGLPRPRGHRILHRGSFFHAVRSIHAEKILLPGQNARALRTRQNIIQMRQNQMIVFLYISSQTFPP